MRYNRFFCMLFILMIFISCSAISEGLLPDLDDVYGVDVPSFTDVINRRPDSIEQTDQGTKFFFSEILSEDYYAYGDLLKEAGCSVDSYSVSEDKIEVFISLKEKMFLFTYDVSNDTMTIMYPEGVYDAVYHQLEIQFQSAVQRAEEGKYDAAIGILEKMPDYEGASLLMAEIYYKKGVVQIEKKAWKQALSYLKRAKGYPGTQTALLEVYDQLYIKAIQSKDYDAAESYEKEVSVEGGSIEPFLCYQPGDSGEDIQNFLLMVKNLGFTKSVDSTYLEKYTESIKKMETRFGLVADGIIYSNELLIIATTVYPGCEGMRVKKILEHIADAGYLTGSLPDSIEKYEQKYAAGVIKAKKICGLTEDRIITPKEAMIIMEIPTGELAPVSDVKVKSSEDLYTDGTVSISWKGSKSAIYYEVFDYVISNQNAIAKVKGTSYKFKEKDGRHQYAIIARNYEESSIPVLSEVVWVGPPDILLDELLAHKEEYKNKYVQLNEFLEEEAYEVDKNALYILLKDKSDNYIYICVKDYKSWNFEVRGSSLYSDGKLAVMRSYTGIVTTYTRWNSNHGDVLIMNLAAFGY